MLLLLPDRFLVPTSATPNLSSENLKHNLYKGSPSLGLTFIDLNNHLLIFYPYQTLGTQQ